MWKSILASVTEDLVTKGSVKDVHPMSERSSGNTVVEVHSECIESVSYDKDTKEMGLKFVKGKTTYTFPDVALKKFFQFMASPSKGKAYWKYFR